MTLAPGGSYSMIRRKVHRQKRRAPNAVPTANPASARAFQANLHRMNPADPYMLYGQFITPSNSVSAPAGSATSPRAQRAIRSLKATNN